MTRTSKVLVDIIKLLKESPYEKLVDIEDDPHFELRQYIWSDGSRYVELDSRIVSENVLGDEFNELMVVKLISNGDIISLPYYAR